MTRSSRWEVGVVIKFLLPKINAKIEFIAPIDGNGIMADIAQ